MNKQLGGIMKKKGSCFLLIGHLLLVSPVFFYSKNQQAQSFQIEDWEKRINKRQPPVKILDAIGVKPGMVIGEVGAGTGRMTMWLAQRVGNSGKVYANDINSRYLENLRQRSQKENFNNIEIILGEMEDPKLPSRTLDIAFMINVYHHLENPVPLIHNILSSLKPDGILAIVECDPEKVSWGEKEGCSGKQKMKKELEEAGFEIIRVETFLNEDNIYIAKPINPHTESRSNPYIFPR
jgi:ubiquinone/menaquinone biosynthesis C-methylase UbiE